jgi:quercetin dioxygenase-like cupin family protein
VSRSDVAVRNSCGPREVGGPALLVPPRSTSSSATPQRYGAAASGLRSGGAILRRMGDILRIDEHDLPWAEYAPTGVADGRANVRVKALTAPGSGAPRMQYVEYAPGHADHVHRHDTGELFLVTEGAFTLEDGSANGPGSVVYIPRGTDYAMRAGADGVRFFRIIVP